MITKPVVPLQDMDSWQLYKLVQEINEEFDRRGNKNNTWWLVHRGVARVMAASAVLLGAFFGFALGLAIGSNL